MDTIELLAPAGDLKRLKIALLYGADAVYIGGQQFSLRSRASNFSLEDIREGAAFAREHGKKVHVTVNMLRKTRNMISRRIRLSRKATPPPTACPPIR